MAGLSPRLSIVVPTMGLCPLLGPCLAALRADGGERVEIVVVDQGETPAPLPPGAADRVLRLEVNRGFAGGVNAGMALTSAPFVGVVNDDLEIEAGWTEALLDALEDSPGAAAVQGINVRFDSPATVDGCGIAWNRSWQAIQRGHGQPASSWVDGPRREEVFGVSATAAIYRRSALDEVWLPGAKVFDERLGSYYEDVDLAVRLRGAAWHALLVRSARARHAGSATGRLSNRRRMRQIYRNRLLVLARLFGRRFWPLLPWLLTKDLLHAARRLGRADGQTGLAIVAGLLEMVPALVRHAHFGPPRLAPDELTRFRSDG